MASSSHHISVNQTDLVLDVPRGVGDEVACEDTTTLNAMVSFDIYNDNGDTFGFGDLPLSVPNKADNDDDDEPDLDLEGVHVSLSLVRFPEFDSFVELVLLFYWSDPDDPTHRESARISIRYNASLLVDENGKPAELSCHLVKREDLAELASIYGETEQDLTSMFEAAQGNYSPLHEILIPHGAPAYTSNLFTTTRSYGNYDNDELVAGVRASLDRKSGEISVLVSSMEIPIQVESFNRSLREIRLRSPLDRFYQRGVRKFIQRGMIIPRTERPNISVAPLISWPSWTHYMTVLGFGAVEEDELSSSRSAPFIAHLRLIAIPGADNRRYFGFLRLPAEVRLTAGERLRVDVACADFDNLTAWFAEVLDPNPYAALDEATILITRRFDKDTQAYDDKDFGDVTSFSEFTTPKRAYELVASAKEHDVQVRIDSSDKPIKRQLVALEVLNSSADHALSRQILVSRRIDRMETFGLFHFFNFDGPLKVAWDLVLLDLNDRQRQAATMCLDLPGGVGLTQGLPGTGKTFWISRVIQPAIAYPEKFKDGQKRPVLVVSASNTAVDELTTRIQAETVRFWAAIMKVLKPRCEHIIIRLHAISSEIFITELEGKKARDKKKPAIIQGDEVDLADMLAAHVMIEDYRRATHRAHGIPDKRVNLITNSLGSWMLLFSGVLDKDGKSDYIDDLTRHSKFRQHYKQFRSGANFDPKMRKEFTMATNLLREDVLKAADVIVTTLSNLGEPKLYTAVPEPSMIFIDEAGRAPEPDIWSVFAHYSYGPKIFVGDMNQLRPFASYENHFRKQLTLSAMGRFSLAGFPLVVLTEQHRFHSTINTLISRVFYDGSMTTADGVDSREDAAWFASLMSEKFNLKKNVVLLNALDGVSRIDANRSAFNAVNIIIGIDLIRHMLQKGAQPAKIAILTPYKAQFTLYRRALLRMQTDFPELDVRGLVLETFDDYQGQEKDFVLVDLVISSKAGFLADPNRLNVGLSRARNGMVIIANTNIVKDTKGKAFYLAKVFSILKRTHASLALRTADTDNLPGYEDIFPKEPEVVEVDDDEQDLEHEQTQEDAELEQQDPEPEQQDPEPEQQDPEPEPKSEPKQQAKQDLQSLATTTTTTTTTPAKASKGGFVPDAGVGSSGWTVVTESVDNVELDDSNASGDWDSGNSSYTGGW